MKAVQRRIDQRQAEGHRCAVRGCYLQAEKLSRHCPKHEAVEWRTGDPLGRTIHAKELQPYVARTAAYILRRASHPGISAGVTFLGDLLTAAAANDPQYLSQYAPPAMKLARWLARVRIAGTEPEELLATIAAVYLLQRCDPGRFPSVRFRRHQIALRVLRCNTKRWGRSLNPRGEHSAVYDRVQSEVRDLLGERLTDALEPLAVKIALAVYSEMEAERAADLARWTERFKAGPVPGSDVPLDPTTTTTNETPAAAGQPAAATN